MKSQPRFCEAEHLWMHNSNGNRSELTPSACQRCGIPWDEFQYQVQLAREFGLEHDGPDDDEPIAFAAAG